jgi:hypothetical protein
MAFLDGCGTASIAFKKSVRGVVEKFIVLGGIVGITVSLQKGETAQAVAQAIIRDSGLHHILTYPYKTNSKMLMVIGKK